MECQIFHLGGFFAPFHQVAYTRSLKNSSRNKRRLGWKRKCVKKGNERLLSSTLEFAQDIPLYLALNNKTDIKDKFSSPPSDLRRENLQTMKLRSKMRGISPVIAYLI